MTWPDSQPEAETWDRLALLGKWAPDVRAATDAELEAEAALARAEHYAEQARAERLAYEGGDL